MTKLSAYIKKLQFNSNKHSFSYILTLLYELPPALSPFCELQRVRLLNTSAFMNAVHEVATQPIAVIYPLHRAFVVSNLSVKEKKK